MSLSSAAGFVGLAVMFLYLSNSSLNLLASICRVVCAKLNKAVWKKKRGKRESEREEREREERGREKEKRKGERLNHSLSAFLKRIASCSTFASSSAKSA